MANMVPLCCFLHPWQTVRGVNDFLKNEMNPEEIKEKLSEYFYTRAEIEFAYLFGSQAKNETGALSDIDIAVYLDEKIDADRRFDIRLGLIGEVCSMLKTDRIDLIVLNDTPLLLSFHVARDGIILCSKDEVKRIQFETKTMSLYFDQEYYYRRHAKTAINRIAVEGIL